jgi:phosphopantetheine--protein transferase-like protein
MLENLTMEERKKIQKYRMTSDQKLSYGSLLLQHHAICDHFGCDKSQYEIHRTSAGKPYVVSKSKCFQLDSSWNYNVSHHGSYVGIVESNDGNIGLDIATLTPRKSWIDSGKDAMEYLDMFHNQFTLNERKWQSNGHDDQERYRRFFINWSLKEAYIKAIGRGLQMDLLCLEFDIEIEMNDKRERGFDGRATLTIVGVDGCPQSQQAQEGDQDQEPEETQADAARWIFRFCSLDGDHVAAIAISPSSSSSSAVNSVAALPGVISSVAVSLNPVEVSMESLLAPPIYF